MRKKKILKIIIHAAIIISWICIMLLLVEKEGLIRIQTGKTQFRATIPNDLELDIWKGIYINKQWIGYVHTILGQNNLSNSKGYLVHSFSFLRFKMFNQLTGIAINALQELDDDFRMIGFYVRITGLTDVFIKGKRLGDRVYLDIRHDGNHYSRTFDAGDDLFLDQSILSIYRGKGLRIGDSYMLHILNPLTMNTEQIVAEVVERDGDHLIMETKFGSLISRAWIDGNGVVIREEAPNGWVMKRETEETINQYIIQSKNSAVDILKETSVQSSGRIGKPRQVKSMMIKVSGVDLDTASLDGPRQRLSNGNEGIVTIHSITPGQTGIYDLPYREGTLNAFLTPSTWIDSEDPSIRDTAAHIVGKEKNSWVAAQKISSWVYANIEKAMSPGIPIATSVLKNRKGDCNEHTVLFIALARAAGIPAEMCAGVVYVHGGFYYHAWPKVYVGSWIHMDPTFGETVADATHFELVSGDFNAQTTIATAIGKIKIEILDSKY